MFFTPEDSKERIGVNSAHMMLSHSKLFLEDVHAFGFMTLNIADRANLETLNLCSPSGHVQIFKADEVGLKFPLEIQNLLFKNTDVKKLSMYKSDIEAFEQANSTPRIEVIELHPVLKKNIIEANNGILNYLKFELGTETRYRKFDLTNEHHIRTNALFARALTYGVWLVASKLAEKAGLSSSANISGYMRYAIFSELREKYKQQIADPYYVPYNENDLSPLHLAELNAANQTYMPVHRRTSKKYRPRFTKPFDILSKGEDKGCSICGYFSKPGVPHKCRVKPNCSYPLCTDTSNHTPLTCRYIRAWCTTCHRRGHIAESHQDLQMPPPYMWALFLHYQFLHMDTSYMMDEKKCENPFLHMFTLYGLPPSKLPKAAHETGVGSDKPNDSRYKRPSVSAPSPQHTVNKFVIPTVMARRKLTSSTTSTSTVDHPVQPSTRVFTEYDVRQACRLAERISRGEEAGTSGTVQSSNPILTHMLNLVQNLRQQGVVPETISQASTSATTSQSPSVTTSDTTGTTRTTETTAEQQAEQLATAMVENVLPDDIVINDSPVDSVIINDVNLNDPHGMLYQDMDDTASHRSIDDLDDIQIGGLLDSDEEDDEEENMDDLEPTGTAAIPQNSVAFYNDSVQVQDQPIVDPAAAILPGNNSGEQSNPETTSQNTSN